MHESRVHACIGPDDPHAFDLVSELPRSGDLDTRCPTCRGHGEWNAEIDLGSFRSLRTICEHCNGLGWIETGHDLIGEPDIVMTPMGYPQWIVRFRKG